MSKRLFIYCEDQTEEMFVERLLRNHLALHGVKVERPELAALRALGSMNGTQVNFPKPVSDVWSFAASLYQLLTGKFP